MLKVFFPSAVVVAAPATNRTAISLILNVNLPDVASNVTVSASITNGDPFPSNLNVEGMTMEFHEELTNSNLELPVNVVNPWTNTEGVAEGLSFVPGFSFTIEILNNTGVMPSMQLLHPLTLTFNWQQFQISESEVSSLRIYYWDLQLEKFVDAVTTCPVAQQHSEIDYQVCWSCCVVVVVGYDCYYYCWLLLLLLRLFLLRLMFWFVCEHSLIPFLSTGKELDSEYLPLDPVCSVCCSGH